MDEIPLISRLEVRISVVPAEKSMAPPFATVTLPVNVLVPTALVNKILPWRLVVPLMVKLIPEIWLSAPVSESKFPFIVNERLALFPIVEPVPANDRLPPAVKVVLLVVNDNVPSSRRFVHEAFAVRVMVDPETINTSSPATGATPPTHEPPTFQFPPAAVD